MRASMLRTGLIYIFPIWLSLSGVFMLLGCLLAILGILRNDPEFLAEWITAMIGAFGTIYCFKASTKMFEEIPAMRKAQKELDKFVEENRK